MIRKAFSFLAVLISYTLSAQNYVPNPSFEIIQALPPCQPIQSAVEFNSTSVNWIDPTKATPDIFTFNVPITCFCHPYSQYDIYGRVGRQTPHTGTNMAGIINYGQYGGNANENKEYIQTKLLQTLLPGKVYYAEMYVSRAEIPSYATNKIGMAFTPNSITDYTTDGTLLQTPLGYQIKPQIYSNSIIFDTANWVKIADTFTVNTPMNYITIGNFFYNYQTAIQAFPVTPGSSAWYMSYYYIDDVYVGEFCVTKKYFDTLSCNRPMILLEPSFTKGSFLWNTGAATSNITVSSPGIYWVDVTLGNCVKRDSFFIASLGLPHAQFGKDTTLCKGSNLTLVATYPNASYLWQDGTTNSTLKVSKPGVYWVTITAAGCGKTDSVNVVEITSPPIDLGRDTSICKGDTLFLNASFSNSTYSWQNGFTGSMFPATDSGLYFVTVTTQSGCLKKDSTYISLLSKPALDLGRDTSFCYGSSIQISATYPDASYLWQDGSTDSFMIANSPGLYWIKVTSKGCSTTDSLTVVEIPQFSVNLGADTSICDGEQLQLSVGLGEYQRYSWQDGTDQSTLIVSKPGQYWINAYRGSCVASDTIILSRKTDRCNCSIFIPTAFTPNGDGKNDCFKTQATACQYTSFELFIFNRWGQRIFATNNSFTCWNGKVGGIDQLSGVYVYLLEYKFANYPTLVTKKGTFLLIR